MFHLLWGRVMIMAINMAQLLHGTPLVCNILVFLSEVFHGPCYHTERIQIQVKVTNSGLGRDVNIVPDGD